jgi:hypothetical protein
MSTKELYSYYNLTEEDLEEITKEWSADLLISVDPMEVFDIDSPEPMHDTPGPSKTKKDEEVQYVNSTSAKTTSISPKQRGDGGEPGSTKVEKNKGEVTPPREEEDPSKKRKVTPQKNSSRKKAKATRTKFETVLTLDEFDFIVTALNNSSLEIGEQWEAKKEEVISHIRDDLQGVKKEIQSSHAVSTTPLPSATPELGDELAQLHRIADTVKAHLR